MSMTWAQNELVNTQERDLPEEWGLRSRGEIWNNQVTALRSRYIPEGRDDFRIGFEFSIVPSSVF